MLKMETETGIDRQYFVSFHGTDYSVQVLVEENTLIIDIEDCRSFDRWNEKFTATKIEEVTTKAKSYKKFHHFIDMMDTAFKNVDEDVRVDFLSHADLERIKNEKMNNTTNFSVLTASIGVDKSRWRYLIFTCKEKFGDLKHFPLKLLPETTPTIETLQRTINRLRRQLEEKDEALRAPKTDVERSLRQENTELQHRLRNRSTTPSKAYENLKLENSKLRLKVEAQAARLKEVSGNLKDTVARLNQAERELKNLRGSRPVNPYQQSPSSSNRSRTPNRDQASKPGFSTSRSVGSSRQNDTDRFRKSAYDSDVNRRPSSSRGPSPNTARYNADHMGNSRRPSSQSRTRYDSPTAAATYGGRFDPTAYQAAKERRQQRSSSSPIHPKAFGAPSSGSRYGNSGYASDTSKSSAGSRASSRNGSAYHSDASDRSQRSRGSAQHSSGGNRSASKKKAAATSRDSSRDARGKVGRDGEYYINSGGHMSSEDERYVPKGRQQQLSNAQYSPHHRQQHTQQQSATPRSRNVTPSKQAPQTTRSSSAQRSSVSASILHSPNRPSRLHSNVSTTTTTVVSQKQSTSSPLRTFPGPSIARESLESTDLQHLIRSQQQQQQQQQQSQFVELQKRSDSASHLRRQGVDSDDESEERVSAAERDRRELSASFDKMLSQLPQSNKLSGHPQFIRSTTNPTTKSPLKSNAGVTRSPARLNKSPARLNRDAVKSEFVSPKVVSAPSKSSMVNASIESNASSLFDSSFQSTADVMSSSVRRTLASDREKKARLERVNAKTSVVYTSTVLRPAVSTAHTNGSTIAPATSTYLTSSIDSKENLLPPPKRSNQPSDEALRSSKGGKTSKPTGHSRSLLRESADSDMSRVHNAQSHSYSKPLSSAMSSVTNSVANSVASSVEMPVAMPSTPGDDINKRIQALNEYLERSRGNINV